MFICALCRSRTPAGCAPAALSFLSLLFDPSNKNTCHKVSIRLSCHLTLHPQVFLIHIMDYAFGVDDGTSKLHHRMRFGPELRIQPSWVSDCCPNRRDAKYRLVSTVTHHGRHAAGARQPL